ncbi:glycerol kinase [Halanaerobium saccharolyticum]|uniref:ATP:glycerol 3-phosphotransferase n=1 Tax=Halanaerobium saccharolyticum TaxID=43595 RepID=A0A4R7YUD5_9FIRM|nr:glycerol kinase GlpK [Halanaerobium saccharolyticum]RAK06291.1 glycerol kinase [Halanaerobium saccharolyticum]TDW00770.1 glycerol kinase [Halanaerobium saccharolyticum]TDX52412.1 glycerol kinase [Halanaerobium saccharolyticum]
MRNKEYLLAVDQSTSGTKALIINKKGKIIKKDMLEHQQFYPQSVWVEHDPEEIYQNTIKVIKKVINDSEIASGQIKSLSITNQRETAVVWDKATGKPVYNAVVWQCQRGEKICNELKEKGYQKLFREKTGLLIDPYFSATGIKWILDNVKGVREKVENGEVVFGTIDSWLIYKLTNKKVHATDFSNASRTMLYNIKDLCWDKEIMKILDIPEQMAPEVKYSDEIFAYTTLNDFLDQPIPIVGVLGDSHAALFGQKCFEKGMAKVTYGTGSSIAMNIGDEYKISDKGIVTSIGWGLNNKIEYIYEGNIHSTGATIKWIVKNLKLISDEKDSEKIALELENNGGVYFIPAFVGLGAPYWKNDVKAGIVGITFETRKEHIVRAALESIAYQIKDVVDLMTEEAEIEIKEIKVDGGPTQNKFLMQFQSDMLGVPVYKSEFEELSAIGAAYLGGLTTGFWESQAELRLLNENATVYKSNLKDKLKSKYYKDWQEALAKLIN